MSQEQESPTPPQQAPASVGRLRRFGRWLSLKLVGAPADDVNEFPLTRDELKEKLKTEDPELAAEILSEARELLDVMVDGRNDSVERRAATLQGLVALAATFALTGGSLVISQINGQTWRILAAIALFDCVACLAMCGWLATMASSKSLRWRIHPRQQIFDRPDQTLAELRVQRAANSLYAAGQNSKFSRWKMTKLMKAVVYLQLALVGLVAFAALLLAHIATGPHAAASATHALPELLRQT